MSLSERIFSQVLRHMIRWIFTESFVVFKRDSGVSREMWVLCLAGIRVQELAEEHVRNTLVDL